MGNKLFWLLLSAFLLAQCCQASPAKEDSSSSEEHKDKLKSKKGKDSSSAESSEEVTAGNPHHKILKYTQSELLEIGNKALEKGNELLKNVLKDETVSKVQTAKMQEYVKCITELSEKIDALSANSIKRNTLDNILDTLAEFSDGIQKINTTNVDQPSAEQVILELAAKKNGILELKQETGDRYRDFLGKFDLKLERFVTTVSEKEKQEHSHFFDWYKQYKDTQDLKQKTVLLRKFIGKLAELESEHA